MAITPTYNAGGKLVAVNGVSVGELSPVIAVLTARLAGGSSVVRTFNLAGALLAINGVAVPSSIAATVLATLDEIESGTAVTLTRNPATKLIAVNNKPVGGQFAQVVDTLVAEGPVGAGRLVVVAGQSNAVGQPDTDHADSGFSLATPFAAVPFDTQYSLSVADPPTWVYNSGTTLRPYNSNVASGINFGPEMTLGRELYAAGLNPVIGKMALNASGLADHWLPGVAYPSTGTNLFTQFVNYITALQTTYSTKLLSIVWVQGEHDADSAPQAAAYAANLTTFMTAIRAVFGAGVSIIIVKLNAASAPVNKTALRAQQVSYVASDTRSALVDLDDLALPDTLHYDGDGQITLGQRCAYSLLDLHGISRPTPAVIPQVMGGDATVFGTGVLTPRSWAGQRDGDREYLVYATGITSAVHALTSAQGFTLVGSQYESSSGGAFVRISVWSRPVVAASMVNGRMPSPVLVDNNGYNIAQIYTVRGPTNAVATLAATGSAPNTYGPSLTLASPSTGSTANCLVLHFVACFSGYYANAIAVTNATLAGVTEQRDTIAQIVSDYMMLSLTSGTKAVAGAVGNATATVSGALGGNVYSLCGISVAVSP